MKKILVAYYSVSGSTREAAGIIRGRLGEMGYDASMADVRECGDLSLYDAVIIGGPMRFGGFISKVKRFIGKNNAQLAGKKLFYFITCLYIIKADEDPEPDLPVFLDPSFSCTSRPLRRMDIFDKIHRLQHYLPRILGSVPEVRASGIAFFNGRLSLSGLGWGSSIFMRIITAFTRRERIGDFLNPTAVAGWATSIAQRLEE